jgi:aminopeptidase-like protein
MTTWPYECPDMYQWAQDLFPICRSITGEGLRETLRYVQTLVPGLKIVSVPTGESAFDWTVPDEWNIRDAYIADETGTRIIDFLKSNLHVMGYSVPIDCWMSLEDLRPHLYTLPEIPDAIPYVTSYYSRRWGFCLSENQRASLKPGRYHVVINSSLESGYLNYGEIILPGRESEEILLSTYVCHPSLANNELSGPVVTAALAQWLSGLTNRRYTYRIVFLPETIGSIVYLSRNLPVMKNSTVAGFVVTCVGDDRAYSFLPSRLGGTLADRVAMAVLEEHVENYDVYSFNTRGSDERQYCSPGVDLPVVSIMRSKYDTYPEYHNSMDNLDFISQSGLAGGYGALRTAIEILERNHVYKNTVLCEPQLGKRGLYGTIGGKTLAGHSIPLIFNVLAYSDGQRDLIGLAKVCDAPVTLCADVAEKLFSEGIFIRV